MDLLTPDFNNIETLANRTGRVAVIDRHSVAIFTPVERDTDDGIRYVSYRVNRVHTFAEAWGVLRSFGNALQHRSTGRKTDGQVGGATRSISR